MLGDQRGVTYLMVMAAVVLMGVAMTVVGQQWSVVVKRDREAELQFRGTRIKTAIEAYAADYEVLAGMPGRPRIASAAGPHHAADMTTPQTDRAGLAGLMDDCLAALVARNAGALGRARYTENG